jgi:hypothetical protein
MNDLKRNDRFTKRLTLFSLVLVAVVAMAAGFTEEKSSVLIKYRNGTVLSFDGSVHWQDEDTNWSFGAIHMKRLAQIRSGTTNNVNANLVTNAFGVTYAVPPQVTASCATNCSVITITTTNVVLWAAATNQNICWISTLGQ